MSINLKDLLGDAYRDDLTATELQAALANVKTEPTVPKTQFDKLSTEIAELKRNLKAKESEGLSELEQIKQALQERETELQTTKQTLVRTSVASVFESAGLSEKEYAPLLELAVQQPDSAAAVSQAKSLVSLIGAREAAKEASVRAQLLTDTPKPGAGNTPKELGAAEFRKLGLDEKQKLLNENPTLFNTLAGQI